MTRFMSHLLTACIGFIGIAGCGAPEDPPEPVAAPEMTKAMPEKIEVEILNISEEFANINTSITREELAEKVKTTAQDLIDRKVSGTQAYVSQRLEDVKSKLNPVLH